MRIFWPKQVNFGRNKVILAERAVSAKLPKQEKSADTFSADILADIFRPISARADFRSNTIEKLICTWSRSADAEWRTNATACCTRWSLSGTSGDTGATRGTRRSGNYTIFESSLQWLFTPDAHRPHNHAKYTKYTKCTLDSRAHLYLVLPEGRSVMDSLLSRVRRTRETRGRHVALLTRRLTMTR